MIQAVNAGGAFAVINASTLRAPFRAFRVTILLDFK
jgi:hypothetical protein